MKRTAKEMLQTVKTVKVVGLSDLCGTQTEDSLQDLFDILSESVDWAEDITYVLLDMFAFRAIIARAFESARNEGQKMSLAALLGVVDCYEDLAAEMSEDYFVDITG